MDARRLPALNGVAFDRGGQRTRSSAVPCYCSTCPRVRLIRTLASRPESPYASARRRIADICVGQVFAVQSGPKRPLPVRARAMPGSLVMPVVHAADHTTNRHHNRPQERFFPSCQTTEIPFARLNRYMLYALS